MTLPVALTIAGSDSSGGAGIQADLKTFHAFGVFGTSAITAVTVQNTLGVRAVHAIPIEIVRAQIEAVMQDMKPGACKTGMLATAELVGVVAESIQTSGVRHVVVDPVMVATSGDRLLESGAERAIINELLPLASIVTPNLDEAAVLTGTSIGNQEQMEAAARRIVELGARAVLVKGGHLADTDVIVDVFYDGTDVRAFKQPRLHTRNTHGTGCALSAAIAADLASGRTLNSAVERAIDFVHRAIASAPGLGGGAGPLNHFVSPALP